MRRSKIWDEIRENKDRDFVFTYSIRHPDKDNLLVWKLVVTQYDYYPEERPKNLIALHMREAHDNKDEIIYTWKRPKGVAFHNNVWFFGKSADDHYQDALDALICDKIRILDELEKRYLSTKATTDSALAFLNNLKNTNNQ